MLLVKNNLIIILLTKKISEKKRISRMGNKVIIQTKEKVQDL